jgi:DNA adenine methylase
MIKRFTALRTRPLVKTHGGKFYLTKFLVPLLPRDYQELEMYDLFGGGGTFLLHAPKAKKETYNDLDPGLSNLVQTVVNNGNELIKKLKFIPYSEEEFVKHSQSDPQSDLDRAVKEVVIRRMSRGGLMTNFSKSNRLRGGRMGDENAWHTWLENHLPKIIERYAGVNVTNNDAIDVILGEGDNENSFLYLDPPYYPATRTATKAYRFEMSEKDHVRFLEAACRTKAKVMISGYDCAVYRKYLKRWKMKSIAVPNNSSQVKNKEYRIECAWLNF